MRMGFRSLLDMVIVHSTVNRAGAHESLAFPLPITSGEVQSEGRLTVSDAGIGITGGERGFCSGL
jgi:hypothetical protein